MRDETVRTDIVDPGTGGKVAVSVIGEAWMATPLTLCCGASATGTEWGVACRGCHDEIDPAFGAAWTSEEEIPAGIRADVMAAVNEGFRHVAIM